MLASPTRLPPRVTERRSGFDGSRRSGFRRSFATTRLIRNAQTDVAARNDGQMEAGWTTFVLVFWGYPTTFTARTIETPTP
jgi:hypothetical protein